MNQEEIVQKITEESGGLVPRSELTEALRLPLAFCPEEVIGAIPSIELRSDGPGVSSVFLLTQNLLCEVRMGDGEFDYARRGALNNYRVRVWTHQVAGKRGDDQDEVPTEPTTYKLAKVTLYHDISEGFHSEITYVGDDAETWVRKVIAQIPIELR